MLKYQVRSGSSPHHQHPPRPSPVGSHRTIISIQPEDEVLPKQQRSASVRASSTVSICSSSSASASSFSSTPSTRRMWNTRSTSLSSLSSIDSHDASEWGHLRVFTGNIRATVDYKTLRISTQTTTRQVVDQLLTKFRIPSRDPKLFSLWMEVTTRRCGEGVKTLLELDDASRPLELQRCHPVDQSRFFLTQSDAGVLVRVHDQEICSESNYKSLVISPRTTAAEVTALVVGTLRSTAPGTRLPPAPDDFHLVLIEVNVEVEIPGHLPFAGIYLGLKPGQRVVIRRRRPPQIPPRR